MTSASGWRGSGASFAKISAGLGARGHTALLITAAPALTERFRAEGLEVAELPLKDTGPREVAALLGALRRLGAQSVLVDTPRDLRLAAYATVLHRAPIVYRYNLNYRRARGHLADRLYARRVAALIFQSEYVEKLARREEPWLRAPGFRVPNGFDTGRLVPDPEAGLRFRREFGISASEPLLVTTAKLARDKGHEVVLRTLAWLRERGLHPTYVAVGNGILEGELRAEAARLDLPARFTGFLEPHRVIHALNAADIHIHASAQEIFPNAVGEAMACARPVVAADAGGTAELVGDDGAAGVLVAPGDPAAFGGAIATLLGNPSRRAALGAAARRRIETEFPLSRMIDGYENALARLAGARG